MSTKEAKIRLEIFAQLIPLNADYNKCEPVIAEIYKVFEKFGNEIDRSKELPWDKQ